MCEYLAAKEDSGSNFVSPSYSFVELGVDGERINIFGQELRDLVPDVIVRNHVLKFTAMRGNPVNDEKRTHLVLMNHCAAKSQFNSVIKVGECDRIAVGSCELSADPFNNEWHSGIVVRRLITGTNDSADDVVGKCLTLPLATECKRDLDVKSDVHVRFPVAERSGISNPSEKVFLTKENIINVRSK